MHEVSTEELQSFADAIGLNGIAGGRCSTLFLFQLYACTCLTHALGDTPKVLAEVKHLEGIGGSRTKPAESFKRPPLLGLKKKHYLVGGLASVALNTLLGAGKKRREFRQIAKRHHNPATAQMPPAVIAKNIGDDVLNLYWKRSAAQGLTGNWIVFTEYSEKNFYLCLAVHDEGDEAIASRIKGACWGEFPFLESLMATTL